MSSYLPRISVVTPSFNQGAYVGKTISSVLQDGYPNLEYIVVDGGSRDESVDVIRSFESNLAYWTSEPDHGQYDAINKGFSRSTGDVMAWLNSDDMFHPGCLSTVGQIFAQCPEISWLTTLSPTLWSRDGRPVHCRTVEGFSRAGFRVGRNAGISGFSSSFIQQESTFWRRSLWEKAGGFVTSGMNLAGDFELWARFFEHAELYGTHSLLGGFRVHGDQKTGHHYDEYCREAQGVLSRYALPKRGYCRSALQRLLRATGFRKPGKWSTYRVEYDFQNDRWKSFRMSIPAVFPAFPS